MYLHLKVLDALTLEERFKKALPLLNRQIEGLKLLQKTRKKSPENEKRVTSVSISAFNKVCVYVPACLSLSRSSVQVLTVRKGGIFPGRQFNLDEEDEDEDGDDTAALERKVHGAKMPEAAHRVCLKELKR